MWDLPRLGMEPMSPALEGGFLATETPGKSQHCFTNKQEWVVHVLRVWAPSLPQDSMKEVGDPEGEKTQLGPKLRGS